MSITDSIKTKALTIRARYDVSGDRPLAGYLSAMGTYAATVGGLVLIGRGTGARLPERYAVKDIALSAIAAHKASRMLTKDAITSPLRAPLTSFEGSAGAGEVNESVTAEGHSHALGELLTCPFCAAVWASTALLGGLVVAPRSARLVAVGLTVVTGADLLHLLYDWLKRTAEG
ncbi:DUF1360 domain-containing protein [Actinokineospora sp. PR83]|uniref:DUF1360 domain-containing protein n=1 Tax=Actinokineospora sp. PR83 TaxID=2884908 RepID=UPI0027E0333A|nr:DUF1360 domain-containing protein [Actinokineospora sp. PR83]MCG8916409.1 DUF1360 domain-containing protein [Actinokineospora sp. PR83]